MRLLWLKCGELIRFSWFIQIHDFCWFSHVIYICILSFWKTSFLGTLYANTAFCRKYRPRWEFCFRKHILCLAPYLNYTRTFPYINSQLNSKLSYNHTINFTRMAHPSFWSRFSLITCYCEILSLHKYNIIDIFSQLHLQFSHALPAQDIILDKA